MDEKLVEIYKQALNVEKELDVPAIVALAQAVLETGWGRYIPIDYKTHKNSHNLFGVKWDGYGDFVEAWTKEEINGQLKPVLAKFKAYPNYESSFRDYAELMSKPPYRKCVDKYRMNHDLEAYVRCIAVHYATDHLYADKVLNIIKTLKKELKGVLEMTEYDKELAKAKEKMVKLGLFKPPQNDEAYWHKPLTKAELAVIIYRLFKLFVKLIEGGE
jgi:flagellum-specific peptidoglycan hydrolase FlgJ